MADFFRIGTNGHTAITGAGQSAINRFISDERHRECAQKEPTNPLIYRDQDIYLKVLLTQPRSRESRMG
ncbi:hypothetical protein ACFL2Q_12200, partial [Thermodesulfobacteriota bacterium]